MKKIIVMGGGISGLATAFLLKQQASTANIAIDLKILEKAPRGGGTFFSEQIAGYLCEWGPNGFLTNKPQTLELCRDLGVDQELLASNDNARKRFIYSRGELHRLPHNPLEFMTSSLISWRGKLRIAGEIFVPKRVATEDESLSNFTTRRLGIEALNKIIAPMASGVFAGNADTMSLKSAFPRIYQLEQEYGRLLKAMLRLMRNHRLAKKRGEVVASPAGPGGILTSFENGIETLTTRLQDKFSDREICLESAINTIRYNGLQWEVSTTNETYLADIVVSALPAYALAEISRSYNPQLSTLANQISYAPLVVVCLGYNLKQVNHDCNGFGYLIARGETIPVLGTLWDSQIFANRAPDGKILFRTMLGGAAARELINLSDDEILAVVEDSLQTIMKVSGKPELVQIRRHRQAIPEYNLGYSQLVAKIMADANIHPGLYIGGNAFFGVGINDCVSNAYRISKQVIQSLR